MSSSPGLYVHVPFCSAICPYCDFAVITGGEDRRARFVEDLLLELELVSTADAQPFDTIYLGGGTPSLLTPQALESILAAVSVTDDARCFMEANPEDVTKEAVARWTELGFRTLSLGVQAFDDEALAFLGRRHRGVEARQAVELARESGFETVSIDLIFGLPDQDLPSWRRELETALSHDLDHISCYQLTIHDETVFGRRVSEGVLVPSGNTRQADLFFETFRILEESGYTGYEVSNFAKGAAHRSSHNEKYWSHTPYVGVGPSAHSFDGERRRHWNAKGLFDWHRLLSSGDPPIDGREALTDEQLLLETVTLRLRTRDGVDLSRVRERFGVDLVSENSALVERLVSEGLIELSETFLRPTVAGMAVADSLAASFRLPHERCQTFR